jgi:radical SAM superfamily enzyme YgiQ (UPF0313 family)
MPLHLQFPFLHVVVLKVNLPLRIIARRMKVLIANPPAYLYNEGRRYIQGGSRWSYSEFIPRKEALRSTLYMPYPFFLGYAASYLRAHSDADVEFLDAAAELQNEVDFLRRLKSSQPDLLVVEAPTVSWNPIMRVLREAKSALPDMKVAVTGLHVTGLGVQALVGQPQVDFALTGEFELTLAELVDRALDPRGVRGLIYRDGDRLVDNGRRPLDADLSRYPYPERPPHLIDRYYDFAIAGRPNVQMLTSRGCPVGCNFCYTTFFVTTEPPA